MGAKKKGSILEAKRPGEKRLGGGGGGKWFGGKMSCYTCELARPIKAMKRNETC